MSQPFYNGPNGHLIRFFRGRKIRCNLVGGSVNASFAVPLKVSGGPRQLFSLCCCGGPLAFVTGGGASGTIVLYVCVRHVFALIIANWSGCL
jgi:hypothetical protein